MPTAPRRIGSIHAPPQPGLDLGYDFIDTAALYGFGASETLIGEAIGHRRGQFVLASKCGMTGVDGQRVIDCRPDALRRTLEESLTRLRTDVIDLCYLHRWDKEVPIEESVDEMANNDLRRSMPRFQGSNIRQNLGLYERFEALARQAGCTPAQLSLVWVSSRGDHLVPIPGTTSLAHLEENFAARELQVEPAILAGIDALITPEAVAGGRYAPATLGEIDSEEFA